MPSRMALKVFFKGHQHEGEYEIENSIVRVFFEARNKAGTMMTTNPALAARLLLIELLGNL
jgi:vacuolar-type H+-ATPase catalytic subunit A/Vma1